MDIEGRRRQLLASLSLALAPVALPQGRQLRRRTVPLAEAAGERFGRWPGSAPALGLLAVGESPLAGVGLDQAAETVACRLAEQLQQRTGRAVHWRSLARGGLTAEAVRKKLVPDLETGPVDLILIALGVNDSLALRPARRWRADLEALIAALHERTGAAPVLLAGVPDMHHFPLLPFPLSFVLGSRARLLDHAAGRLARLRSALAHVPMALDARAGELFCEDGFHPNRTGHERWAEQLAPAALELLREAGKLRQPAG